MTKTLLYCPMLYHHDKGMWPPVISSTAYFLWQKNLWDIFKELEGWRVLWNGGQPNSNLYDPIQEWKADNIRYTRMDINKALKKCDRVLVDVPSTVMWDAKKAGKSCLCIAWDDWGVRMDAKYEFLPNMLFVPPDKVKGTLLRGLDRMDLLSYHLYEKFIQNENDWLKEIAK